jgi:hypothetical protein
VISTAPEVATCCEWSASQNSYDKIDQALAAIGDVAQARDHLQRALTLYEEAETRKR